MSKKLPPMGALPPPIGATAEEIARARAEATPPAASDFNTDLGELLNWRVLVERLYSHGVVGKSDLIAAIDRSLDATLAAARAEGESEAEAKIIDDCIAIVGAGHDPKPGASVEERWYVAGNNDAVRFITIALQRFKERLNATD